MTAHGLGGRTDLEGCSLKLRGEVLRICSSLEVLVPAVISLLPLMSAEQHKSPTAKKKSDTPHASDPEEPEAEENYVKLGKMRSITVQLLRPRNIQRRHLRSQTPDQGNTLD